MSVNQDTEQMPHFKLSVPNIAILATLLIQSAIAFFWAGAQSNKLENIGAQLQRVENTVDELNRENRRLTERITRLEK